MNAAKGDILDMRRFLKHYHHEVCYQLCDGNAVNMGGNMVLGPHIEGAFAILKEGRCDGLVTFPLKEPRTIKGINTAGQALHPPPTAASTASRGVLNPSFPHSLDHARASTVAISLRSSIKLDCILDYLTGNE
ncbi:MAG: hypothetical protein LBK61_14670 [Spirochaetaceae bacterium]|nr:hypothetical protein [Spirochaetaceae bacterium]